MHTTLVAKRLSLTMLALLLAFVSVVAVTALFGEHTKLFLLVVGVLLLSTSLAILGNPRLYCLWGLILTAPMDVDVSFMPIPHMGGAAAYTIDLVDFFLIPLILFLLRDLSMGRRRHLRLSPFAWLWGGLIVLGVISVILGPYRHVPLHEVVRMTKMLLLFLVFINEVVRVKQFKHVFAALMVGLAIQCAVGLIQYLFEINLGAQVLGEAAQSDVEYTSRATYGEAEFTYRIGALFGHSNLLSIYLAMMMSIAIAMLFTRMNPIWKPLIGGLVLTGIVVLILTLSRSGWVSFAIAFMALLGLSFVHPRVRRRFLLARAGLIGLTMLVIGALSGPILKRIYESDSGAISFRFEWMELAWRMIQAEPVLGVGLNTFIFEMAPYSDYGSITAIVERFGPEQYLPVVHNIYLLIWAEQGTLGLLLFLGAYAYLMATAWRNAKHYLNESLYMMNLGCIAGLLALAADGMVSFFIRTDACGRVFMIVAGLVVAIDYWRRENTALRRVSSEHDSPEEGTGPATIGQG